MRVWPLILMVAAQLGLLALGSHSASSIFGLSFVSSAVLLESRSGFEELVADLGKSGIKASAPAMIVGKSGVKHEFALAVMPDAAKAKVVVDAELSVKEVDEMKVLKFYVKVFDVSMDKAILCVTPRLNERAATLAREYGITVVEDEVPRNLIVMASKAVREAVRAGTK